jgi:ATP-dependent DNA helicase RecG
MDQMDNVTIIKGVGEALATKLKSVGIESVGDLIDYYPRRYDDYSRITSINQLMPGAVTIEATIKQITGRYVRRGMHITEAIASDSTGSVRLVWFNQPYRQAQTKPDQTYYISGLYELSHQRFAIMNPSIELKSAFPVNTARIIPIYRETKGLKSLQIRKLLREVAPLIQTIPESLPQWLVDKLNLPSLPTAIMSMHFPDSPAALERAKKRLGFQEVFALSLAALLNKQAFAHQTSLSIPFDKTLASEFVGYLPFDLTDAQRKAIWQIYLDMQKNQPMNRLLEGDVGSGKTVVAAMAALMAIKERFQVALMAPTELLARQHATTIHTLLAPMGMAESVGLLTGSLKPAAKKLAHKRIKSGDIKFMVGTHALVQEKVDMHHLGLIIVDEQHRFGVEQRKKLQAKAGHMPHVLTMTATPIPRSLALTLYGELDTTILDSKPKGRKPIITTLCSPNSRPQLYQKIDQELAHGRQMFVVCPLIAESETLKARSAETVYSEISKKDFKHCRVGLLHGKMKPEEKAKIMEQFARHELDILVATTVIEVGVDVPNATVMLIENAERFGLAQIHQLRGRVGRSDYQGHCYLMLSDSSAPSRRLRALESSNDGFKLAELDMEIRGPGAIYGTMQHGQLDLRIAKLTDTKLIAAARQAAQEFINSKENLLKYQQLNKSVQKLRSITNLN